jgi:dimethylhistidine N-methyltransferase
MSADILAYRTRREPVPALCTAGVNGERSQSSQPPSQAPNPPRIIVQSVPEETEQLRRLVDGLIAPSAAIDPKYFYDPQGCALFSAICALDEYYPTRTEAAILEANRFEILAALPENAQWIDLGCGDCAKSRAWLSGYADPLSAPASAPPGYPVARFVGVDIAHEWLTASLAALARSFPAVPCVGIVADFTTDFDLRGVLAERADCAPVFFYPGSSIGNFAPDGALAFLKKIRSHIADHPTGSRGGGLMIGVDLVKAQPVLEAAYDDGLGVTAAFNRNVLRVVNRLTGTDFSPERFEHVAFFNPAASRIEMHLRSAVTQDVTIAGRSRRFETHETIVTEYSYKYTRESFGRLLAEAGFGAQHCWTDERGWFGVWFAGLRQER